MESSLFEDLLCFLQKEELVLKALRATDLKACLRTGTGTRGYEANAERAKYYRIYNKIEKQVTADQKATLMDWERRLCSEAEDIDFARLLTILENRQDDLRQMQKTSLVSVLRVVSPAGLLRGFTEATVATSLPPGTGRAKLRSASSMVEAALESQTSTAASVQPPVVND